MANRRLGGMGGPQRGHRSFSQHQPFQGNNVSPWQGPSNNSLNQGLLGQLATNPQQLALALSNLLQPQQQMNNPPSLLSLNTSPAFSHQDRDSLSRFNRGRSDFRRNEPYKNRNGGGWRQMDKGNSRNNRGSFGRDRKRSPMRSKNQKDDKQQQRKVEKKEEKLSNSKDDKLIDLLVEEARDDDGNEETKRGWKEEKNITEDNKVENDDTVAENDGDDTNANNDNEEVIKKAEKSKDFDGKYFGVPQKFLHCFVCNKNMWDGESFEKHIRGRAHKQMLQSLEESFHITVNILRENMRLAEEKKVIELNRMHRLSKNKFSRKFQEPESHCNMCDLKFLGKIIAHRKTEGHQRLKRFLHPNCNICTKEFPSRMDWVDHRLTPEHLRQLNVSLENKVGQEDGAIIEQALEADLEPILEESIKMEDENPIIELTDDLSNLQNRIPSYKNDRSLGTKNLKPFQGFLCDVCNRSFENNELAQAHLKTVRHYYTFVEAVKLKFKQQSEDAAAKEAENKKRKREESEQKGEVEEETLQNGNEDMYDPEEACKDEDELNKKDTEEKEEKMETEEDIIFADDIIVKEEVKEESQEMVTTPTARPRRCVAAKTGVGAKGKKLTTNKQEEIGQTQQKSTLLSSFRIPKLGDAAKIGAGSNFKRERK